MSKSRYVSSAESKICKLVLEKLFAWTAFGARRLLQEHFPRVALEMHLQQPRKGRRGRVRNRDLTEGQIRLPVEHFEDPLLVDSFLLRSLAAKNAEHLEEVEQLRRVLEQAFREGLMQPV